MEHYKIIQKIHRVDQQQQYRKKFDISFENRLVMQNHEFFLNFNQ